MVLKGEGWQRDGFHQKKMSVGQHLHQGSDKVLPQTQEMYSPLGYKRYSAKQGFYFRYIIRRNLRGMNRFLKTLQQLSRTLGWIWWCAEHWDGWLSPQTHPSYHQPGHLFLWVWLLCMNPQLRTATQHFWMQLVLVYIARWTLFHAWRIGESMLKVYMGAISS